MDDKIRIIEYRVMIHSRIKLIASLEVIVVIVMVFLDCADGG